MSSGGGVPRREAILQAGPVRLRPILMTTFAMVFDAAGRLRRRRGSETRSPMGIAVIGGLLTSLFSLTLVVVPAAYDLFDDWQGIFKRRRDKRKHREV